MKFLIEKLESGEYVIAKKHFLYKTYYDGKYYTDTGYPHWTDYIFAAEKYYSVDKAENALKKYVIDRYSNYSGKIATVKEYKL